MLGDYIIDIIEWLLRKLILLFILRKLLLLLEEFVIFFCPSSEVDSFNSPKH